MFQRMHQGMTMALGAVALGGTFLPAAHAAGLSVLPGQTAGQMVRRAHAPRVGALVWADSNQGSSPIWRASLSYESLVTDSDWSLTSDHHLIISKDGIQLLTAWYLPRKAGMAVVSVHARTSEYTADGYIIRNLDQPATGEAHLFITLPAANGVGRTIEPSATLTFAGDQNTPTTGGGAKF